MYTEVPVAEYDPVDSFMQFGVPRDAAKEMLTFLQRTVAPRVCALLPGVEYSAAPGALVIVQAVLMKIVPDLTAQLIGVQDAYSARGVVSSSVLPLVLLEGVNYELIMRSRMPKGRAGTTELGMANPTRELEDAGMRQIRNHPAISPDITKALGKALADAVTESVQDQSARRFAAGWTGWALQAAMAALAEHDDELPVPGRGAPSSMPGQAFLTGRAIVIMAGQGLTTTPVI